jgi:hypothetical protein
VDRTGPDGPAPPLAIPADPDGALWYGVAARKRRVMKLVLLTD